jgi:hypothetical protein
MRAISTLRLADEDVEAFLAALDHYGYEHAAVFLRACAYALIESRRKDANLVSPIAFQKATDGQSA